MREYSDFVIYSKELKRDVDISISLPESYKNNEKRYAVLYMTDGQNLFDDSHATYGKSWGILEAYQTFSDLPELIIVGIASNDERSNELVPFKFAFSDEEKRWGGKTDKFLDFIVNTLMKHVNEKYKTFVNPRNTGIMGSSFGGVCATYAAAKYNRYFTKFGCVSNACFPIQTEMIKLLEDSDLKHVDKIYMDVGTKESKLESENILYLESNKEIYSILSTKITPKKIKFDIIKDAIHNESAWELRFPTIIKYLFNQ